MSAFSLSLVLYFLSCAAIIAIFVTIVLMTKSRRQMPRRLASHFGPSPFGKGIDFQVSNIIRSQVRIEQPEVLFTLVLFGNPDHKNFKSRYLNGLVNMLVKKHRLWPKAQVRLYISQSVLPVVRDVMLGHGVDLYVVTPEPQGFEATLWRFWAFDDADVPVVSFDADDDMLCEEYVRKLKAWIASDKLCWVQTQFWTRVSVQKISACKIGCKPGALRKLCGQDFCVQDLSSKYTSDCSFGVDEGFLNKEIWPRIRHSTLMSSPTWTEYCWFLIGGGFIAAVTINMWLVSLGLAHIREREVSILIPSHAPTAKRNEAGVDVLSVIRETSREDTN